jgi:hypothetical protein
MATLLLSTAGSFVGGFLGPFGAMAGRALGAIAGSLIDQALVGAFSPQQNVKGPRLTSVDITASTEGAAIARVIGRSRIAGQMIWATRFEEEATTEESGGKGLGGSGTSTTTYAYYANFAVALCEGPITRIGRIWMDGREVDQTQITVRKYLGTEAQEPDSLIVLKEGSEDAPAYRGIAYLVFERLALSDYGNRMPIVTAEVFRAVGNLEPLVKGVALLPGSTEFGYDPDEVVQRIGPADYRQENRHTKIGSSNFEASLDLLEAVAPNCGTVSLVVAWFGDDLRCGECTIQPKVEIANKTTLKDSADYPWKVAGVTRSSALVVSQVNGAPAFGGSPNDESVVKAIQELKARLQGDVLPLHHDGHRLRQHSAESLQRQCLGRRTARLSVARPDHLLAGGRVCRHCGQDCRRWNAGLRLRRHGGGGRLRLIQRHHGGLQRSRRVVLPAFRSAHGEAVRARRGCRSVLHRL